MSVYVAMLRGINLGSHKRVSMADLRTLFEALGHGEVRTYVQSGNVVFASAGGTDAQLTAAIEREIKHTLALDVVVVLRTAKQLAKVIEGNPFSTAEPGQLHVTFLAQKPSRAEQADLAKGSYPPDEFRIVGREVYLRCPNGYGRTRLGNQFLEKKLGVSGTTRNWRTVTTLAEMAAGG